MKIKPDPNPVERLPVGKRTRVRHLGITDALHTLLEETKTL